MLDVGQGLAMVIERHGKAILYDTGLAWPGGDSAQQLIIPWLRWHHLKPEGAILSHEHLDHAGTGIAKSCLARNVDQEPLILVRTSSVLSRTAMAVAGFNVLRALATRKHLGER